MKIELSRLFEETIKEEYRQTNKYGYLSQMSVLVSKSLLPSMKDISVVVNYNRYIKEMDLWMDYRSDANQSLLNIKNIDGKTYWEKEDDSIIYRMIPLIITNRDEDVLLDEIIKNILFTSGSLKDLFKNISLGYLIYLCVNKLEDPENKLKEMIIRFGQNDFLDRYSRYYRLPKESYPKNYTVNFEKEKIGIINFLNGVYSEKYKELKDVLAVMDGEIAETSVGNILYTYMNNLEDKIELPLFYKNMGQYLLNLRKSKISPDALLVDEYILPDVFKFEEGDKFYHTLLNDSEVLKKEEKDGVISSLIKTKTGIYLFRR